MTWFTYKISSFMFQKLLLIVGKKYAVIERQLVLKSTIQHDDYFYSGFCQFVLMLIINLCK